MRERWKHDTATLGVNDAEAEHVTKAGVLDLIDLLPLWRKTQLTPAVRMLGAFVVETREGPLRCPDGYLAVDAHGWPYPIAKDEFERIYEAATDA